SLAVDAETEAQDVIVDYRFSDGDAAQTEVETIGIATGDHTEIYNGLDIEGYGYLRFRQRDNAQNGGGTVDYHGVLK
ncbi:hypothetical protein, partial [Salmonella enterica]|uniref:hypothetical protein n=1 Tax=Salmonella enterica TaxID=28901 RepID=UPI0039E863D3